MMTNSKINSVAEQMLLFLRKCEKDNPGEGFKTLEEFKQDPMMNMPLKLYEGLKLALENPESEVEFIVT